MSTVKYIECSFCYKFADAWHNYTEIKPSFNYLLTLLSSLRHLLNKSDRFTSQNSRRLIPVGGVGYPICVMIGTLCFVLLCALC